MDSESTIEEAEPEPITEPSTDGKVIAGVEASVMLAQGAANAEPEDAASIATAAGVKAAATAAADALAEAAALAAAAVRAEAAATAAAVAALAQAESARRERIAASRWEQSPMPAAAPTADPLAVLSNRIAALDPTRSTRADMSALIREYGLPVSPACGGVTKRTKHIIIDELRRHVGHDPLPIPMGTPVRPLVSPPRTRPMVSVDGPSSRLRSQTAATPVARTAARGERVCDGTPIAAPAPVQAEAAAAGEPAAVATAAAAEEQQRAAAVTTAAIAEEQQQAAAARVIAHAIAPTAAQYGALMLVMLCRC